jgi:hypothetical protein
MGGILGAILTRFFTNKYDNKLSGKAKNLYKKGILVGKQQYLIVKPLNALMLLAALYVLLFQLADTNWLLQSFFVLLSTSFIFLERPKVAIVFHSLILLWFVLWVLQSSNIVPSFSFLNLYYDSLPGGAGILAILAIFAFLFDISLMENLRNVLKYGGISQVEREKIKEYLQEEKNS